MKKIKDTLDKSGNIVELWHSDTLAWSPAFTLFLRVYADTVDQGMALNQIPFKNNNRIAWAQDASGKVLGGICYEYFSESKTGWIVLSFTAPECRGIGINELCHEIFENDCKALGANNLASLVSVNNESRIKSAAKVGMLPKFYRMQKKI